MSLPLLALAAVLAKVASACSCDIFAAGGTPCVAAHSTTRALYSAYDGPLYQVTRNSDNTTTDVHPLGTGGIANSGTQDDFCTGTTCLISIIYDQSGNKNHLTAAPEGSAGAGPLAGGFDFVAGATGAPIMLGGKKVYGVFTTQDTGYRAENTTGPATGNDPEGTYAVVDGTVFSPNCCFDYGNAENNATDTGQGSMEALMFGQNTANSWVRGTGKGPWLQVDMENGAWAGGAPDQAPVGVNNTEQWENSNPDSPTITDRFLTGFIKGDSSNLWATRGGNAQSGTVDTYYSGPRPTQGYGQDQYFPMRKQGSIILGIGGDNSRWAQGVFYEGAMTTGYPTDDTENAVQKGVVDAGYDTITVTANPPVNEGSIIQLQNSESSLYLAHDGNNITALGSSAGQAAQWKVVAPNSQYSGCFSLESVDQPGWYLRHWGYQLFLHSPTYRSEATFDDDSSFCPETGFTSGDNAFRSYNYPTRFLRQIDDEVWIGTQGGPWEMDGWADFTGQASWTVTTVG